MYFYLYTTSPLRISHEAFLENSSRNAAVLLVVCTEDSSFGGVNTNLDLVQTHETDRAEV